MPDLSLRLAQSQPFGIVDAALVGHLQEQQIGELLDVVAVVDAVVAQGVAEAPEFLTMSDMDDPSDGLEYKYRNRHAGLDPASRPLDPGVRRGDGFRDF